MPSILSCCKQRGTFDADAAEAHTMFTYSIRAMPPAMARVPLFSMRRLPPLVKADRRTTWKTRRRQRAGGPDQSSRIQLKGKKWKLNDIQINIDEGGGNLCLTLSSCSCSTSHRRGVSQDCRPPLSMVGEARAPRSLPY